MPRLRRSARVGDGSGRALRPALCQRHSRLVDFSLGLSGARLETGNLARLRRKDRVRLLQRVTWLWRTTRPVLAASPRRQLRSALRRGELCDACERREKENTVNQHRLGPLSELHRSSSTRCARASLRRVGPCVGSSSLSLARPSARSGNA
jgi:hypothetical protein